MRRILISTIMAVMMLASPALAVMHPDTPDGQFHAGNPLTGQKGTPITAEWLNSIMAAAETAPSGGYVLITSYASLTAAVTAIGGVPTELLLNGPTILTADTTVPANIMVRATRNGPIDTQGHSLTFSGKNFAAGDHGVFLGSGTVTGLKEDRLQWFGAIPDDAVSDTAAIAKAMTAAAGGVVRVTGGKYLGLELDVPSNTRLVFEGGGWIEKDSGAAGTNIFNILGVIGSHVPLTANATIGADTVIVGSTSAFTVNGLVQVADNRDATYGPHSELNEVVSKDSTSITLKHRLIRDYTTANTAYIAPFSSERRGIILENPRLVIPTGTAGGGILFNRSYECQVLNPDITGANDQASVNFWMSAHFSLTAGAIRDGQNKHLAGTGYGFSSGWASHNGSATLVKTFNVRENAIGLNCRHIKYHHNEDVGAYDNSYNTHNNASADCEISDNTSIGSRGYGIVVNWGANQPADHRIVVKGNKIYNSGLMGIYAVANPGEPAQDNVFADNVIYNPGWRTDGTELTPMLVGYATRPVIQKNVFNGAGNTAIDSVSRIYHASNVVYDGNTATNFPSSWGLKYDNVTGMEFANNRFWDVQGGYLKNVIANGASTGVRMVGNKQNSTSFGDTDGVFLSSNDWNGKPDEDSGVAMSVGDGGTINFNIAGVRDKKASAVGSVSGEMVSVTYVGSNYLTVAVKKHDGTAGTAQTIYWRVWQ